MDLGLTNKIALVTASSSGLGQATALQLLQEGAKVAVCSRSMQRLKKAYANVTASGNIAFFEVDITDEESIKALINEVVTRFGGLDILVTNIAGPGLTDFENAKEESWYDANESIVMSCVHLVQAALPYLKKSKCPSILTVTSFVAKQIMPGLLLSNVYRPAVIGLTKALSKELGKFNIRVNSILPGFTLTERLQQTIEHRAKNDGVTLQQATEKLAKSVPLGKIGTPEEFAKVATFLVSAAASYVTGVMMQVDGGVLESIY